MGFLGALADQLSDQFSLGENTQTTLNLGDVAIDKSEERKYVEEGFLRKDPYNTSPKQFEVLMQEPNATILVKKRMFTSLAQNYRPDYMDKDERLFFKTMKILFNNKCRQIAALEKLSKIEKVSSILGQIDNQIVPLIMTLADTFSDDSMAFDSLGSSNPFKNTDASKLTQTIATLRKIYSYNQPNKYTTWLTDNTNVLSSQFGEGSGVIEFTNFTTFSTTTGTELGKGNCSFTITDPYESMLITDYDIERAIADATNGFYNNKTYQLGKDSAEQLINDLQTRLNKYRSNRHVSPITFRINPDTLLGKRVVAIIDSEGIVIPFTYDSTSLASIFSGGAFGGGTTVADEYLRGGAVAGENGLDPQKVKFSSINSDGASTHSGPDSELSVFQSLIGAIFSKLSLIANSVNAFQTTNAKTNYVRRKMRFNFLGKLLIQPMDVVHIYISSKSRYDNRLTTGLNNMFTGMGFLQNLNNMVTDFKNAADTLDSLFNNSATINLQAEKCATVGPNFPNSLWAMMRGQFITENEGAHVFGGVVNSAVESWGSGKYSVAVSCSDNSSYFDMGKVNFNPGVDVFNGSIYDPLTPFKSTFDTIDSNVKEKSPELLEENKWLLSEDGSSTLAKHKSGPTLGQSVTENNIMQDQQISSTMGVLTKTFYLPDGLVYKWKEGIGVLVQYGEASLINGPDVIGAAKISKDPFAGQDVMNVLSLLVTGAPYNFMTYWKTAINNGSADREPLSQQDASYTYMESLRSSITKNNMLWGNFIPFKNLMVDDKTYSQKLRGQFDLIKQNGDLNSKLDKLRDVTDGLSIANGMNKPDAMKNYPPYVKLQEAQKLLKKDIETSISQAEKLNATYFSTFGDDVTLDDNAFLQVSGQDKNNVTNPKIRRMLRRQINNLTRRMSYNVRANDDKNFFIVDDFYDKDYDIAAYNQGLNGIQLYSNAFSTVKESIRTTANLLNLEVFCDSQGHIRVRPPQYNRMPSSVFYKMMYLKESLGVQIFPQFLQDLFTTNINTLVENIEIIEDQIRLYCAALGYNDDVSIMKFFNGQFIKGASMLGEGEDFRLISDQESGVISDISVIVKLINIEAAPGMDKQGFTNDQITLSETIKLQASSTKQSFTTAYRAKVILEAVTKQELGGSGYKLNQTASVDDNPRVTELIDRIQTKSGQRISKEFFKKNINGTVSGLLVDSGIDVFKITTELGTQFIPKRQKAIKVLYSALKNAAAFRYLDDNANSSDKLFIPGNFGQSEIPEVFEHMLEDESYDDLGFGSGSRYIIRRPQIRSMTFKESQPKYTSVEVRGVMNPSAPEALPPLNTFPDKGNAVVTAMAIDYDMWRNYGISSPNPVDVPFLSDPNTQCAPFATMLLSRARKEVLSGSITISGNEYMQPGEVVFIEDRGLLFYVTSVTHSFTYGSSFTTQLELTYGHAPGEYIPTTLDVIGKMIFNNKDNASITIQRQTHAANESSMGVLQRDKADILSMNPQNKYDNDNMSTIKNILYSAQQLINANNTKNSNSKAMVQLRIYYDDNNPVNNDLLIFAEEIRDMLTGVIEIEPKTSTGSAVDTTTYFIKDNVEDIVLINMSDETVDKSPSQRAFAAARLRVDSISTEDAEQSAQMTSEDKKKAEAQQKAGIKKIKDKLRAVIFNYIVDCWIVISEVEVQE